MRFLILGPLEVRHEERPVALAGIKLRVLLAVLLFHANEAVSAERLALALWGDEAPSGASKTVQAHVWRLRKALGDRELIATTPAGYCLRVDPEKFDAAQFERLAADGRRELVNDRPEQAATLLRQALGLWRGPALAELSCEPFAQAQIARLEEQRLAALETRIEADLAIGRHAELVGELRQLVAVNPTRERLAAQLMLALYRCGRQTDALGAYRDARHVLIADVGVEPGPRLRELQDAILRHDATLELHSKVPDLSPALDAVTVLPPLGDAHIGRVGPLARDFLAVSDAHQHAGQAARRRRVWLAFAGLSIALAVISVVVFIAVRQSREAERLRDIATSRDLAARATRVVDADRRRSLALARRAIAVAPTQQAATALRRALLAHLSVARPLQISAGRMTTATFAVTNNIDTTISIPDLVVAARDTQNDNRDFPSSNEVYLQPGQTYRYRASQALAAGRYTTWPAYYDGSDWHELVSHRSFTVP
jgi:DNA-binding SARP family transcriptional activator